MLNKAHASNKSREFFNSSTFLVLLGICLVAISVFIWKTQESKNLDQIAKSTEAQARFYASEAEIRYGSIYDSLDRLASRGDPQDDDAAEEWQDDATFYQQAFVGIRGIIWIDKSFRIKLIIPTQKSESYHNKRPNQLPDIPSHVYLWVPSYNGTAFRGYVLGIIDVGSFIKPVVQEINNDYMLRLSSEGKTIFVSQNWQTPQEYLVTKTITFENAAVFALDFAPTEEMVHSGIIEARKMFLFSLFISTLTVIAVYFAQNFNAIAILNELRYRNLFEASRDAIFIIDVEGQYQDANPAALDMVGYSLAELQEMPVDDLRSDNENLSSTTRSQLWAQGGVLALSLRHKKGQEIPVELMFSPIREGGTQKYVLGIARDITARIQAEKKLAQYRDHLEELVKRRTSQLKKTNQELTEFAYVVSHDLKAPLRGIIQLSKWISKDYAAVLDEQGLEMLDLLEKRTLRMHYLIQGILEYSRIGRVKEKEKSIDLNQLVTDMVDALAPPDHINIAIEDKLPVVYGEPTHLLQVFQNLVENAVKYIDKEKGDVRIRCVERDKHWQFSITDNGIGIEEKYFKKIFNMFQTLAPQDQDNSTGVGLALVKKIVAGWEGNVWVESEPGEGSSFLFTMPKPKK